MCVCVCVYLILPSPWKHGRRFFGLSLGHTFISCFFQVHLKKGGEPATRNARPRLEAAHPVRVCPPPPHQPRLCLTNTEMHLLVLWLNLQVSHQINPDSHTKAQVVAAHPLHLWSRRGDPAGVKALTGEQGDYTGTTLDFTPESSPPPHVRARTMLRTHSARDGDAARWNI